MRLRVILIVLTAFSVGAVTAFFLTASGNSNQSQAVKSQGKPLIGGPFALTDHTGQRVSDKDFLGKFSLVYFGYTYCPDVCPTGLQVISAAIDNLGPLARDITPVFITVDPERDTPEQMKSYVTHFHPKMVGLTGSAEDIRKAAKAYKVYYGRSKSDDGTTAESSDYLMDHSNIIYLMDKNGNYLAHFTHTTDADKLAKSISKNIGKTGS